MNSICRRLKTAIYFFTDILTCRNALITVHIPI